MRLDMNRAGVGLLPRARHPRASSLVSQPRCSEVLHGGRTWVRRSETNRPSKCLEDTRGELTRKGLTHRRMSNDSPKIEWSCQRVNEQVGVGILRQFSGRDGLLDQVYIHGPSRQIETFEEESPKHGICLNITDQADGDGCVLRMKPRRAADHTLMQPFERRSLKRWRQRRFHPCQKCVEHVRLLALPPTIQSGRAHAGLPGQFLRRYGRNPPFLQQTVRRPENGLL